MIVLFCGVRPCSLFVVCFQTQNTNTCLCEVLDINSVRNADAQTIGVTHVERASTLLGLVLSSSRAPANEAMALCDGFVGACLLGRVCCEYRSVLVLNRLVLKSLPTPYLPTTASDWTRHERTAASAAEGGLLTKETLAHGFDFSSSG